jgi:hypothetical protein
VHVHTRLQLRTRERNGTLGLVTASVRRAPRFKIRLWVQVTGIDPTPVLRDGDISASGLYFALDHHIGDVGSVQRLVLRAEDDNAGVVVLARLVRVSSVEDLWKGRLITGAAFQFAFAEESLPGGTSTSCAPLSEAKSIQRLLRKVVESSTQEDGVEITAVRGTVTSGEEQTAVRDVSLRSMALETDYSLSEGETIRVEMPAHGLHDRVAFDGLVVASEPMAVADKTRFRVVVRFGQKPANDALPAGQGESIDDAFNALLEVLTDAEHTRPTQHLAGQLSRISLSSVLTLCQIERVTGILRLEHGTSVILAYLRDGELVDATIEGRDVPPRVALREVLGWQDGTFAVAFEPVEREDRVGVSTTSLLLDLAREADEELYETRRAEGT